MSGNMDMFGQKDHKMGMVNPYPTQYGFGVQPPNPHQPSQMIPSPQFQNQVVGQSVMQSQSSIPKSSKPREARKKVKPVVVSGPTNKEQFTKLFAIINQQQEEIKTLKAMVTNVKADNDALKAVIALSNITPKYGPASMTMQQLPQIYATLVQGFKKCVK